PAQHRLLLRVAHRARRAESVAGAQVRAESREVVMGELVLAAKITHVPSIWLSLQDGKHHGIRRPAEDALRELGRRAHERAVDTFVVADTHWLNSSGFHLNAKAVHSGSYASHELPHFIRDLPYTYPGDPELTGLIGEEIRAAGLKSLVHDIADLGLEYG